MNKELVLKYFSDCGRLVRFVNYNHIERLDIQEIIQLNGDNWAMLYWK